MLLRSREDAIVRQPRPGTAPHRGLCALSKSYVTLIRCIRCLYRLSKSVQRLPLASVAESLSYKYEIFFRLSVVPIKRQRTDVELNVLLPHSLRFSQSPA